MLTHHTNHHQRFVPRGLPAWVSFVRPSLACSLLVCLLLSACSSDDAITEQPATPQSANAIVLGVSEVASPVSRAPQQTGSMTFSTLAKTGFGVYGYEGEYNSNSSVPTLFKVGNSVGANTHVTFEPDGTAPTTSLDIPGSWDYTNNTTANLKEWKSGEQYTFFAYAPYVSASDFVASGTAGINSVKTTDASGEPTVQYTVAEVPSESVDLLWGVRTDTKEKSGLPWIDIQRGQTTSAVLFTFYHALCAIGLHAQVMVDQKNDTDNLGDLSQLGTIGKADGCKVTLKSITITPIGLPNESPAVDPVPFYKSGTLNLNNTTAHQPLWIDKSETGNIAGLVLNSQSTIDSKLLDPATYDPESPGDDFGKPNPDNYRVMTNAAYDDEVPGITESANTQTIIKRADPVAPATIGEEQFFMLIPQDAQDYTVTVQYFLTYKTGSGYHREAKEGTATFRNLPLTAGVKYYLNLVFGLTTFKLTVDAVDWEEQTVPVTIATETGTSASHSLAPRRR